MKALTALTATASGCRDFILDTLDGLLQASRYASMALGASLVIAAIALATAPDWRAQTESQLGQWLNARQVAALGMTPDPDAVERATATDPATLPVEQARVALWIARKYKVAPEPLAALVSEAYRIGDEDGLDPTLILAVMAIESRFNPFAESPVGAQGLMQVMTNVHTDKYVHFGGDYAAFDPRANLRVGVRILKQYIDRAGSVRAGLKWYVGAAKLASDGGYADKVLAEHARLQRAAATDGDDKRIRALRARREQAETRELARQDGDAVTVAALHR